MSPRPFAELTRRGQVRRLHRAAGSALERYAFAVARVRLLATDANTVFRVDASDGAKYVLRITSPRACKDVDEIRSEVEWLSALKRDTDLPVAEPVAARDGSVIQIVAENGIPDARPCVVFRWVAGPHLHDRLSGESAFRLGELAAGLHVHAGGFRPSPTFRVRRFDRVFPWSDASFSTSEPVILFDPAHRDLFPPVRRRVYEAAIERVQSVIDAIRAAGPPEIVIHNDLHPWNVKVRPRGRLHVLDFEDLMWGHPVQDVATSLYYLYLSDDGATLCDGFRAGYEQVAPWPEREPHEIEVLRAGRGLVLANWVLSSHDSHDRELAPEYMARIEKRLRAWLGL
jgi:Ser/Thr protein kinase RdoA (MazF antagonist)